MALLTSVVLDKIELVSLMNFELNQHWSELSWMALLSFLEMLYSWIEFVLQLMNFALCLLLNLVTMKLLCFKLHHWLWIDYFNQCLIRKSSQVNLFIEHNINNICWSKVLYRRSREKQ